MVVSPKWQTMWLESQHCSKTTVNVTVPSQQSKKLLEDLRASCSSPNKAVQLEALKCWGVWINNQNQEDWKLNTVCYTAVRPLLTKKLQPLQKDGEICKLRFSLMWALLRKVQNIMHLEGPQYILEVFLQSCLNWFSSGAGDGGEEITELIFQLLLGLFSREESANTCEKDMFPPLSADVFKISKVFNCLVDKLLNVFAYWKKVQTKNVILKLWRHFLGHCEHSYEHVAVPVWHRVFKLVGQICSEKSEPVKERLGMIHGCATMLRSVLSSSKFLDYGNSLMTPCEALFKKLVDLSCSECEEFYDAEMFVQGLETSKVLSMESVAIGGYGLSINVLNLLEEFSLRALYWGVWCGLVHCYESLLSHVDENHLSNVERNFYRKLRGVAINFELDKDYLGEESVREVERYIRVLNLCLCPCRSRGAEKEKYDKEVQTEETSEVCDSSFQRSQSVAPAPDDVSKQLVSKTDVGIAWGRFPARKKAGESRPRVISINFDLVNRTLDTVGVSCVKSFLNGAFHFRFISLRVYDANVKSECFSFPLKSSRKKRVILRTVGSNACENMHKKAITYPEEKSGTNDEVKSVPKTRSRKRAEEEEKRKEIENQKRKTRKSFEIRVQEIVQKNKERKTEKNFRKSPVISLREKRKNVQGEKTETSERKYKKRNKKEKSPKLEKYFKVISKTPSNEEKEETPKGRRRKKKEEINWKQTSLKTMMMPGKETENERVRTRNKEKVAEGRVKVKVMEGSPLVKMSPFKEVFHDHEYARMELPDLRALERVIVNKEESEKKTAKAEQVSEVPEKEKEKNQKTKRPRTKRTKAREGLRKSKRLASETDTSPEAEIEKVEETKATLEHTLNVETVPEGLRKSERFTSVDSKPETPKSEAEESFEAQAKELAVTESFSEIEKAGGEAVTKSKTLESFTVIKENTFEVASAKCQNINSLLKMENVCEVSATETRSEGFLEEGKPNPVKEAVAEVLNYPSEESKFRTQSPMNVDDAEEYAELDSTPRRGKKRFRILDSLKPSKKVKLEDPQEKLALEVEKENLEEVSPTKEEKSLKGSPKTMSGMISSRALRMIALLPESTRSQVLWETSPKIEVKKKGPNVDKNSRASKMLALLSENVREKAEPEEIRMKELKSNEDVVSTPVVKTPTSSLKSPKTTKQRRSIRFDDTKNETVVYETDTPPSQVLEGKERWRRIQPSKVNSPM